LLEDTMKIATPNTVTFACCVCCKHHFPCI